jgi:hypothetical protein
MTNQTYIKVCMYLYIHESNVYKYEKSNAGKNQ